MGANGTAIVVTTDGGYLPAACCALLSCAQQLPAADFAALHLAYCDAAEDDLAEAARFFAARGARVEIVSAEAVAARIKPFGNRWPRAAYLRLYFDEILSRDFSRVAYFDADTRARTDLRPLLEVDLKGRPAAAVHDFIYYLSGNIRRRRRDLFLAADAPYLQSGVMVFDWPQMLRRGLLAKARDFLAAHPERCLEAPDQDALNAALEGEWTPLDPRWNLHELYLTFGGAHAPYIEHYTSTKPWSRRRPDAWRDAAAWYAAELAGTKWADFIPAQSPGDRVRAQLDFLRFRYAPALRDALADYAPFVIEAMGKSRVRPDTEELPWAPKSRRAVEAMTDALIAEAAGARAPLRPPESVLASHERR